VSRRRWLGVLAALLLLALLGLAWLFGTSSGAQFAFQRLAAGLPELALRAERIQGRLGRLRLSALQAEIGGRALRIDELALHWHPLRLALGELRVEHLEVRGLHIGAPLQPAPAAPFDADAFEWRLPDLRLPFALELSAVVGGPAQLEGAALFERLALSAHLARDGRLELRSLQLQRGADSLSLQGRLPAGSAGRGLRGSWRLRGVDGGISLAADAQALALALSADAGRAELALGVQAPRSWQLQVQADQARLAALAAGLPEPLSLRLGLRGEGGSAHVKGRLEQGALALEDIDGGLRWLGAGQRLQIDGLQARRAGGGRLRLEGELGLADPGHLDLRAQLQDWPLGEPGAAAADILLAAELRAKGAPDRLDLGLEGSLRRAAQTLPLTVVARLVEGVLQVDTLRSVGAAGRLAGSGRFAVAAPRSLTLRLEGEQFDPGWLAPALRGSIGFAANLDAREGAAGWEAVAQVDALSGRWFDAPLAGSGRLAWRGGQPSGTLAIDLGSSRLRLAGGDGALRLDLQPLQIEDLHPQVGGQLRGQLQVRGLPDAALLSVDLEGADLAWQALEVGRLSLRGDLAERGEHGFDLAWTEAVWGDALAATDGSLAVAGNLASHRAELRAHSQAFDLEADWHGDLLQAPGLRLERLSLHGRRIGRWELRERGRIGWAPSLQIDTHCLASEPAQLCIAPRDQGAGGGWQLRLQELPLQRLAALLDAPPELHIEGTLGASLALAADTSIELGEVQGSLGSGAIRDQSAEQPHTLLAWESARWSWRPEAARHALEVDWQLLQQGRLQARLQLPADAPLDVQRWQGSLVIDIAQLQALALLAPDLGGARGALRGRLDWDGTGPASGQLVLEDFSARVPALGIGIRDSTLSLHQSDGQLVLDGVIDTGEGPLRIEGSLLAAAQPQARLRLAGSGVLLADTRQLTLRVSPDIDLRWRDGGLRVRGELGIPQALIDLERLEAGVRTSSDVQVIDPREQRRGVAALPIDLDLRVVVGDAVRLSGFGFDGRISGTLALRESPGRPLLGRGTLDLGGSYRAYGQELEIERGRLLFASSPLDNPGIDLRARRVLREVEVGVQVRGPARRPQLSLWSQPTLDQAEALSWLVLGRPLASATESDGAQLGQAAAAVGGNLLAARVGGRLGFDTFGIADSQALGGAAFTVGKYLSPRLYLGYGVGLFEQGRVVTLRYLLNRQFDIELESARESRAGINFRTETD
jgi:translocation and assembly module TamB